EGVPQAVTGDVGDGYAPPVRLHHILGAQQLRVAGGAGAVADRVDGGQGEGDVHIREGLQPTHVGLRRGGHQKGTFSLGSGSRLGWTLSSPVEARSAPGMPRLAQVLDTASEKDAVEVPVSSAVRARVHTSRPRSCTTPGVSSRALMNRLPHAISVAWSGSGGTVSGDVLI